MPGWSLLVATGVAAALLCGCSQASAPASSSSEVAATPSQTQPPAANAAASESITLTDIFPAGTGREQVLNACGSCHSVACVALGRKTAERWDSIKASHMETVSGSGADLDAMFAYLKEHFNDTKPEPQVPPQLLQQGCTPF